MMAEKDKRTIANEKTSNSVELKENYHLSPTIQLKCILIIISEFKADPLTFFHVAEISHNLTPMDSQFHKRL